MAKIPVTGFTMGMPKGMNRMEPFALDLSSIYTSYEAMETYAKNSAISYIGQILSLINYKKDPETEEYVLNDNGEKIPDSVTVYSIQDEAGTLKEVGTVPVGDEKTIVVAEDGTISLAGIDELSFTKTIQDEEGNESEVEVKYQALLTKNGLTWIEPSATTVEGLDARLKIVESDVTTLKATIGNEENGLSKDVLDNKNAINAINETLNGTNDNDGLIDKVSDIEEKIGSQSTGDDPATGLFADIADLNLGKADKLVEGDLIKVEVTIVEDSGLNITKVSVKTNNTATQYDPGKLYKPYDIVYVIKLEDNGEYTIKYFICIEENNETIQGIDLDLYKGEDDSHEPFWAAFFFDNPSNLAIHADNADIANVAEYASTNDAKNDISIDSRITSNANNINTITDDLGLVDNLETTSKTVVGAINEVKTSVSTSTNASKISINTNTTTEGALKSYTIVQGENTIGTIDIPKDMVVTSGEVVVDPEGQASGTYIKLVLANVTEPLYINVGTLVDIYKAKANATQVQITIDSSTREISAAIVAGSIGTTELADNAVTTIKIADANVTKAKLSTEVQASLDKADSALTESKNYIDGEIEALNTQVTNTFEEKSAASAKLIEAKGYTDSELIRLLTVERIG